MDGGDCDSYECANLAKTLLGASFGEKEKVNHEGHPGNTKGFVDLSDLRGLCLLRGGFSDGAADGGAGEQAGGVKDGQWRAFRRNEQWDFSAAEDDGVAAFGLETIDNGAEDTQGFGAENSVDEFVEDNLVDFFAVERRGNTVIDAGPGQDVRVNRALHRDPGSRDGEFFETTSVCFAGDFFHDVQPGKRRVGNYIGHRVVDGVVRTEQEIGADGLEFPGGGEHQSGDTLPVPGIDELHVFAEREGVHRNFRMHVAPHERGRFIADGAVAEGGALGAAGNYSDVTVHGFRVTQKTDSPQRH